MTSPGNLPSPVTSPLLLYPATPIGSPPIAQHSQWNVPASGYVSQKSHPMYIPTVTCYYYTDGSVRVIPVGNQGITVGSLRRQLYLVSRGLRARDLHVRSFDGGHLGNHVQLAAGDRIMVSLPMQVHVAGCGMVKCWPHDPVIMLQRAVESRCGTPVDDQVLLFNAKALQPPDARLCAFSLQHGSGVMQSGRLRAGGKSLYEATVREIACNVTCGSGDVPVGVSTWLEGSSTQTRCKVCQMILCDGRCLDCGEIVDQLSWSTRKYLYSAAAMSDREFIGATPYMQACINRYIGDLNAVASGDATVSAVPMELEPVGASEACQVEVGAVTPGDATVTTAPMELEPVGPSKACQMDVGAVASGDASVTAAPMELEPVGPSNACQMEVGAVASADAIVAAVPMELEPIEQMEDWSGAAGREREVQRVATSGNRDVGGGWSGGVHRPDFGLTCFDLPPSYVAGCS